MGVQEGELVRRVYAAFNRRDLEGGLQHLAPAVTWQMSDRFARRQRVLHGHDGVREVVGLFDEALEDFRVEPVALHEAPGVVVAELRAAGRVRGTGDVTGYDLVQVWRIDGRMATTIEAYATLEDAWPAAGMTPPAPSSASISPPESGRANR
ncbi:MAG: nuclear transport factor 2 family protein [Solirubrobacteraceae bacterium]